MGFREKINFIIGIDADFGVISAKSSTLKILHPVASALQQINLTSKSK